MKIKRKILNFELISKNQKHIIIQRKIVIYYDNLQKFTLIRRRHTPIINPPNQIITVQKQEKSQEVTQDILTVLKQLPLTKSLSIKIHEQLVPIFSKETFKSGQTIIQQGDGGDRFYILVKGKTEVFVNGEKVFTYTSPSGFGDLALLYQCPRSATIKAIEDCICYTLTKAQFNSYLMQSREKDIETYKNFIKTVPYFNQLSDDKIFYLAQSMKPFWCQPDTAIIKQGEYGSKMYFIEKGEVAVYKNNQLVAKLCQGNYFGEAALIHNKPRNATIKSVTECQLAVIEKQTMINLIGNLNIEEIERGRE